MKKSTFMLTMLLVAAHASPLFAARKGFQPIFDFQALPQSKQKSLGDTIGWLLVPEVKYDQKTTFRKENRVLIKIIGSDTPNFDVKTNKVNFVYIPHQTLHQYTLPRGLYRWDVDKDKQKILRLRPYTKTFEYEGEKYIDRRSKEEWLKKNKIGSGRHTREVDHERHPSAHFDGLIYKPNLFEWVMGLNENAFLRKLVVKSFEKIKGTDDGVKLVKKTFPIDDNRFPNRKLIRPRPQTSNLVLMSIDELRSDTDSDNRFPPFKKPGYFRIIKHDPSIPRKTAQRALQANPNNKGATFGIASTHTALEGKAYEPRGKLTDLNVSPVQGEEASLATMGATIYRMYYHKLLNLSVNFNQLDPQNPDKLYKQIRVGIHYNVRVIGDYHPLLKQYGPNEKPRDDKEYIYSELVTDTNQIIDQVFTFALNTKGGSYKKLTYKKLAAKLLLQAAVEGTVRTAVFEKSQDVFLPLFGLGSFDNNPNHFLMAIENVEKFIAKKNLRVNLVYRPHPYNWDTWKSRFGIDKENFLKKLKEIAENINKKTGMQPPPYAPPETLVTSYPKIVPPPPTEITKPDKAKPPIPGAPPRKKPLSRKQQITIAALAAAAVIGATAVVAQKKGLFKRFGDWFRYDVLNKYKKVSKKQKKELLEKVTEQIKNFNNGIINKQALIKNTNQILRGVEPALVKSIRAQAYRTAKKETETQPI
jgi:hypothetical protein